MSRPKSKGAYTPLAANYYMDDAILEVGPDAELLFVRCLSFLASIPSDGFITDRQIKTIVGLGLRTVPKRLAALVAAGLLEVVEGGYVARSWLKWNKSTEQIGKLLAKDRQRKAPKDGENGPNSARNPNSFRADSELQSRAEQSSTEQNSKDVAEIRSDVSQMCEYLAEWIEKNGSKKPVITKAWETEARLLIDKDGRDFPTAMRLICWSQEDSFWKGNVLSMPTFRKKYDQLRLAANRQIEERKAKPTRTEQNLDVVAQYAALEQKGISA